MAPTNRNAKKKHIIFDNDGVNIDSEDVAMRVMDDWGAAFVKHYKPEANLPKDYIYTTYPGTSTNKIVEALITNFELPLRQIARDYKIPGQPANLEAVGLALGDVITIETNKRFESELKSIPGTTQALLTIHHMFGSQNVALMTTSREDRMNVSLLHAVDPHTGTHAQLDQLFPLGSLRRSGYGHANKYDEGFTALGWKPAECIIVEDSLSGVTKARAGRSEIDVIGTVAARFYTDKKAQAATLLEAGAAIVISHMSDLPKAAQWIMDGKPAKKPAFTHQAFFPEKTIAAAPQRPLPAASAAVANQPQIK